LIASAEDADAFVGRAPWCCAARLSLDAGQPDLGSDRVQITVSGQPDLVDAFEMACSLGPIDCLVEDVSRYPGGSS
jgi:hypothetical protein